MGQSASSIRNQPSISLSNPILQMRSSGTVDEKGTKEQSDYVRSAIDVLSINRMSDDVVNNVKDYSYKSGPNSNNDYKILYIIFACNFLWTLLMTGLPVVFNLKPLTYYHPRESFTPPQGTSDWYTCSDVIRLVEPLVGLPFQLALFICSGVFEHWDKSINCKILILLWVFSASIYEQGAGFHSASNMYKNALESYNLKGLGNDGTYDDPFVPLYYYMRTVWEHNYSHYMYACGYAGMQIMCCIAYSDKVQDSSNKFDRVTYFFMILAACIYGLLLMAVGADFPNGLAAMLGFTISSIASISLYLYYLHHTSIDTSVFKFCRRPMLYFYLISYSIGLILVLIWIAAARGLKSRSQVM